MLGCTCCTTLTGIDHTDSLTIAWFWEYQPLYYSCKPICRAFVCSPPRHVAGAAHAVTACELRIPPPPPPPKFWLADTGILHTCLQALVCTAGSSLAVAVALIQLGGGGSNSLASLVLIWASSLPLGLLLQAILPLPPPQGPLPYGGLTPNYQLERAAAYRCVRPENPGGQHTLTSSSEATTSCTGCCSKPDHTDLQYWSTC